MSSSAFMPCCQLEKSKSLFDFFGCFPILCELRSTIKWERLFPVLEKRICECRGISPQNWKCAWKQQNKDYVTICCSLRTFGGKTPLLYWLNAAKFKFGHLQISKPTIEKVDLTYFIENAADFFGWKVQFLRTILWLFCQVSPSQRHQGQHVGIPYQNQSKNDFGDFRENKARQALLWMRVDPIRLHAFKTSYLKSFLPKRAKHQHTFNSLAQRL